MLEVLNVKYDYIHSSRSCQAPKSTCFSCSHCLFAEKKMYPISVRGPVLEVHPVGQGSALNAGPMHMNEKKKKLLQVCQHSLPPLPIWPCLAALSSRLWVGGSLRPLGQHVLLNQLFFPPQMNGSGPDGSVLWDRAGSSTWEDHSEYYIYFCLRNLSYYVIRTTSI